MEAEPAVRLRAATAEDAEAIVALLQAVAAEGMLGIDAASLQPQEEAARLAALELEHACALVVVHGAHLIGFAVAIRGLEASTAHAATVSLAVETTWRRHGIGQMLLQGVRVWAAAAGLRRIGAGVARPNEAALALFHRAGYAVEGVQRDQLRIHDTFCDEVLFGLVLLPPDVSQ